MAKSIAALLFVLAFADNTLTPDEQKAGTRLLFNGTTVDGWLVNSNGNPLPAKNLQDGSINPHGAGGGLVYFKDKFDNFVLSCDFKMSENCNSGIFFRVGDPKDEVERGLEVQVLDSANKTKLDKHDGGALYDIVAPSKNAIKKAGEWNHAEITANKNLVTVVLNGQTIVKCDLDKYTEAGMNIDGTKNKFQKAIRDFPRQGYVGFQDHDHECWFKNIKITPLK